jgi:peptidoglycan/xylan/chitin deacetylase (PgdA/CDA1 family)
MRAYVLTYHSGNIAGNDHAANDLVALGEDLAWLHTRKIAIVPLRTLVDALLEGRTDALPETVAAITLDDGLDFDYVDLIHPTHGPQRSVATTLAEFARAHALAVHATSFVIASPDARTQIARREMLDHQWIGEHWWQAAVASGHFHVANHGWDHLSPSVTPVAQHEGRSGSFKLVSTFADADTQVRVAHDYIAAKAPNPGTALYAYPYGDPSDYLVDEYLPLHGPRGGTLAAFVGGAAPVHARSPRWRLPRYICGMDWRSTDELAAIVRD